MSNVTCETKWMNEKTNQTRSNHILYQDLLQSIMYNKPRRCSSGSIVFINNYKYALHVSDDVCFHHQEHYKL